MQVEDGVGDNTGCALLVPTRGHHEDGYIMGSDHAENHFIPLHNARWADGQPPEAVSLQHVRASVVHHHVRQVLLEGPPDIPLHLLQIFLIFCAPLQFHLPPDGLFSKAIPRVDVAVVNIHDVYSLVTHEVSLMPIALVGIEINDGGSGDAFHAFKQELDSQCDVCIGTEAPTTVTGAVVEATT